MTCSQLRPLIFLDFDGVIVTRPSLIHGDELIRTGAGTKSDMISPECLAQLQRICDETGAGVVISSMWRKNREGAGLPLLKAGFKGVLLGDTPNVHATKVANGEYVTSPRGAEILVWLWRYYRHDDRLPNYVVLDDESDAGFGHDGHFVQCGIDDGGLTQERADAAINILRGKVPE